MRVMAEGHVTVPKDVCERAGLAPGTEVDFVVEAGTVRVFKCGGKSEGAVSDKTRGQILVERLRGSADIDMTTDEIMALMRGPPP